MVKDCNVCTDFKVLAKQTRKKVVEQPMECPPDAGDLGRSTWTFLHTMAAYYPEKPTETDKVAMNDFIHGLTLFYPCGYCADHLKEEVVRNPPRVGSNVELSDWFCQIHNEVNERQGKPKFDCSKVFERWKIGAKGSNCFPD
jgi:mitochondrial FAD-linked sulfhydryl oxidase